MKNNSNALDDIEALLTSSDTSLDTFEKMIAFVNALKTSIDDLAIADIEGLSDALTNKANKDLSNVSVLSSEIVAQLKGPKGQGIDVSIDGNTLTLTTIP